MATDTSGLDAMRLNLGNLRGTEQTTALRSFGLGRAQRATELDVEALNRDLQRELQEERIESTEGMATSERDLRERLAGQQLDFGREQLDERMRQFDISSATGKSQFGETFGLEEEKFGFEQERFNEQMELRLKELFQQGQYQEGLLDIEGRKISAAGGEGEALTAGDFSNLLDQLIEGKLELQEGEQSSVQDLLGGNFNPADPFGTNPEGAENYFQNFS